LTYKYVVARGTTVVQTYNATAVRLTTYSLKHCSIRVGLSSTLMMWLNNVSWTLSKLWIICATPYNQVRMLDTLPSFALTTRH